jgi:hypothetical protein
MSTYDLDEWIDTEGHNQHTAPYHQHTFVDATGREIMEPKEQDVKAMRAIVADAVLLFAKRQRNVVASCFNEKDSDWQLALSEAVVVRDHPHLKDCCVQDAIFFIRMTEVISNKDDENMGDPRVFVAPIIGTPNPRNGFESYSFRFWSSVDPGWRGSERANARSNARDVAPISQCILDCLSEAMLNQMPVIEEVHETGGAM